MKKLFFLFSMLFLMFSCDKNDLENTSSSNGISGSITRFAVSGQYMYVLNQHEVQTYDISDSDNPVLIHHLAADYGLETIHIYDNTIFLGSTTALYILDIQTNPAAPALLSKTFPDIQVGPSHCDPVVAKGNYVYSTIKITANVCGNIASESALVVYDVTDLSAPEVVNSYLLSEPNGLGYQDDYLFICDEGSDKIEVFDITKPAQPELTGLSISITDPVDLIIDRGKMIVSTKTDFLIFDISDVQHIQKLGKIAK